MQIHPLFTVKKAAEVLGVEKQFLRDQLEAGSIRGEQRRVGERDKWFIYHGEVKDLRETKRLHELLERAKRISTDDLEDFFEPELEGGLDAAVDDPASLSADEQLRIKLEPLVFEGSIADTKLHASGDDQIYAAVLAATTLSAEVVVARGSLGTGMIAADETADEQIMIDPFACGSADVLIANLLDSEIVPAEASADAFVFNATGPEFTAEVIGTEDSDSLRESEPELEHFNDTVSGSTSITLDVVLQKLTVEFAYRLGEERSRVCELERLLEVKEESLRQLPDLEKQLKIEQETRLKHEEEVTQLQQKIRLLEDSQAKPKKSWWQSLFTG